MKLRNRDGTPVDPVPFLVVALLAFAVCYSYGPAYFAALGFDIAVGVAASTAAFLGATAVSYYRLVWATRPERPTVASPESRLYRLVLATLACLAAIVLLALPLVAA